MAFHALAWPGFHNSLFFYAVHSTKKRAQTYCSILNANTHQIIASLEV